MRPRTVSSMKLSKSVSLPWMELFPCKAKSMREPTFTVDIPLEITDKECNKSDTGFSEKVNLTGVKVLLVEDNELNAEILTELLKIEGSECTICENGEEILKAFEQSAPGDYDMILMDVQMPVMNGYEATKAIRRSSHELAKTIPIIAMTANAFSEDI